MSPCKFNFEEEKGYVLQYESPSPLPIYLVPVLLLFASAGAPQTCAVTAAAAAAALRAFVTWFVHPNSQTNVQTDAETDG